MARMSITVSLQPFSMASSQVVDLLDIDGFENVAGLQDHVPGVLKIVDQVFAPETEKGQGGVLDVAGAGDVMVAVVGRTQTAHKGQVQVPERAAAVREKDARPRALP